MNKIKLFGIALAFLALMPITANASKEQAINELLDTIDFEDTMKMQLGGMGTALAPMLNSVKCSYEDFNKEDEEELSDIISNMISPKETRDFMVKLYSKYFTEQEIEELTAFYKTPTGKKTIELLPKISEESFQFGMEQGKKGMMERVIPYIEKITKNKTAREDKEAVRACMQSLSE